MTLEARLAITTNWNIEKIKERLIANGNVDAVFLTGSHVGAKATKDSDYDLIIVLKRRPKNLLSTFTYIDHLPADIFFYSTNEVRKLLRAKGVAPEIKYGWLVNWLKNSEILLDKSGLLRKLKARRIKITSSGKTSYAAWYKINYNFVQNTRYFKSGKKQYLEALDLRFLYSLIEIFCGYFNARQIPWRGEKLSVQYLERHNPKYLRLFQKCLSTVDRREKYKLYKRLVGLTLAPVGGTWDGHVTAVQPEDMNNRDVDQLVDFWSKLMK